MLEKMTSGSPVRGHDIVTAPAWHVVPFAIMATIALVDVLRAAWADLVVFLAALVLAAVQTARPRRPARALRAAAPVPVLVVAASLIGTALMVVPRRGLAAGCLVGIVGAGAWLVAWLGGWPRSRPAPAEDPAPGARPHSPPGSAPDSAPGSAPGEDRAAALRRAVLAWSCLVVVLGLWEFTAYLTDRFALLRAGTMPSITDIVEPLLDGGLGKAVFVVVWLLAGVRLLSRAWSAPGADPR